MPQYGWTLKILCWMREVSHKRLYIDSLWFHLYEMSRIGKSTEIEVN